VEKLHPKTIDFGKYVTQKDRHVFGKRLQTFFLQCFPIKRINITFLKPFAITERQNQLSQTVERAYRPGCPVGPWSP